VFTGLVEEVGVMDSLTKGATSTVIKIRCKTVLEDATKIGDSIAVNGVCLTVTSIGKDSYTADVMNETLQRSNLGSLKRGEFVNLERAMAAGGRFGGHIVSGHIDGCATVTDISEDANAVWYTITAEPHLLRYIVEKGSIAIDGISLTVASVDDTSFRVSTIPHTGAVTNLKYKTVGSVVNLECDIIGKYVEKLMLHQDTPNAPPKQTIDTAFLAENGFL
jgi:riboflavin synthase